MHSKPQSSLRFVTPFRALDECCTRGLGHPHSYGNNHEGTLRRFLPSPMQKLEGRQNTIQKIHLV